MTSTHDESGDDTTSSLGDSSYDFVEDRSCVTTDDEDHDALTESTTSSDGHAFEQVHVPLRGLEQGEDGEQHSQSQRAASSHNRKGSLQDEHVLPNRSPGQVVPDLESHHEHESTIEFDEPSITNLRSSRFTEVSHTLKIIEKQTCPDEFYYDMLDRFQGHLAVTVRQTMTCWSLTPKYGQYKILFVGDSGARGPIIQKIGTALAANLRNSSQEPETPRSSRFNIVPISAFGEEGSPEVVLIDSSGLELTVEDCNYASCVRKDGSNDSLRLELSGATTVLSSWDGAHFTVSSDWKLPDLAVFCLPDSDNFALKMTRQFARSFMSRHKVLSIVISQSPTWDKSTPEPVTLDYLTPHICLESRKSSLVHAQVLRRYPIDLQTFLDIDAGQMNRNLACLAAAPSSSKSRQDPDRSNEKAKSLAAGSPWSLRKLIESMVIDVQKDGLRGLNRYEYLASFVLALMSLLGMVVLGLGFSEFLTASRVSTSRVFPTYANVASISGGTTSTTSLTVPPPHSNVITSISSSSSFAPTHLSPTKSLSANTDLASFLLDAYTLAPNKSDHFKVHVLGDYHIVLRPPHWFTKMKKSPILLFKILRGDLELEHETTALFDGVYALQIPREHAYGMLNVAIWTESKPIVNEKFEVDFGSSWLKVAGWRRATRILTESLRGDLRSVQTGLSTVYDNTKTSLSTFVQQQKNKIVAQRLADRAILRSHLEAATKTKDLIVAQTKDLQLTLSKRSIQVSQKAEGFSRDLILYTHNKTSTLSQQARLLARTATGADIKALLSGAGDFRRRHLRETQKRALKAWWSLKGAPKPRKLKARTKNRSTMHREI